MAAAGLDSITAIVGFTIFSALAIPTSGNQVYGYARGPLAIAFGLVRFANEMIGSNFSALFHKTHKSAHQSCVGGGRCRRPHLRVDKLV